MAKLESLIVDIQAETAKLRSGLDDAKKQLKDFDKTLKELAGVVEFKALGEMAVEVGRKLAEVAIQGAETAEGLVRLSQSTGESVEQLQRLQFAAKAGGLEGDVLAKAFNKLDQSLAKAAAGVPQQAALFNALGIAVKDAGGKVRGTDAVLADISERFAGMADGASKAALAAELFGTKNGAALIPLLNSLKETSAEADRLGLVIDAAGIKAAAGFGENLHKLDAALETVKTRVAAELGPSLKELTDQLLKSKEGADSLRELSETLAGAIRVLSSIAVVAAGAFEVVGKHIAAVASALVHFGEGDLVAVGEDFQGFTDSVVEEFSKTADRLKTIWDPTTKEMTEGVKGVGEAAKGSADKTMAAFEAGKKALEDYKTSVLDLKKLGEEEEAKVASFGLGPLDQLLAKLDSGAMTKGIKSFTGELKTARDHLVEITKQLADLTAQHANIEINFNLKQQLASIEQGSANSAVAFQNIGAPDAALRIAESMTGGFKDFTQALATYTDEAERAARDFATAERNRAIGNADGAMHQKEFGELAQKNADAAKRAAEGFDAIAKYDLAQTQATIESINRGLAAASSQLTSKLGDLGQVIQSGVQGFQSGGPWGALAAVVIDLFSRFHRFAEILQFGSDQVSGLIAMLAGPLSKLTDGFKDFMKMSGVIAQIVGDLLGPAIREVGRTFKLLAGFLTPVLNTVRVMADEFAMITAPLQDLMDAFEPLQFAVKAMAVIFNAVSLSILGTEEGVLTAAYEFLDAVYSLLHALKLDDLASAVSGVAGQLRDQANKVTDQINKIANDISNPYAAGSGVGTDDGGKTLHAQLTETTQYMQVQFVGVADQAKQTAAGLAKLNESLTNTPQGFKYALEKFNATTPGSSGPAYPYGNTNGVINVQVTVQGSVTTEQSLVDAVKKGLARANFRNSGTPTHTITPL